MKHTKRVRKIARAVVWRKVSSARYRSCAHEYITRYGSPKPYKALRNLILEFGKNEKWRSARIKFLRLPPYVYWLDSPVVNRTYELALDNGGYPSKKAAAKIQKRFWAGVDGKRQRAQPKGNRRRYGKSKKTKGKGR